MHCGHPVKFMGRSWPIRPTLFCPPWYNIHNNYAFPYHGDVTITKYHCIKLPEKYALITQTMIYNNTVWSEWYKKPTSEMKWQMCCKSVVCNIESSQVTSACKNRSERFSQLFSTSIQPKTLCIRGTHYTLILTAQKHLARYQERKNAITV